MVERAEADEGPNEGSGLERELKDVLGRLEKDELVPGSARGAGGESLILGDFRILKKIGSGGMASVYEAEQISVRRRVALKILPSHLSFSDEAVMKFQREAEAAGRQSHPGIVSIYAAGEHEGSHYIAQELVPGGRTLADRLEQNRAAQDLSPDYFRDAARLVQSVADALHHAHQSGVIHRDVKPSNILLAEDDRPRVTDFGLAKVEDAMALSRTGDFTGTPYYMSPEQALSRRIPITHSTDIFSLGVTLYELLTLERPFEGETSHEVLKKVVFHDPRDPRRTNSHIPRDLAVICLKAMEKKPEDRYASMAEFDADLGRFLNGETILARPASLGSRLVRRVRRNPALSAAAGLALLLLFLLVFALPWIVARAEHIRRLAVEEESRKTQAIVDFQKAMLSSADPDKDGREVMVVDVLRRAEEVIDESLDQDPAIETALRRTIAETYLGLGLHEQARTQFEAARDASVRASGEDDDETLYLKFCVASAVDGSGESDEAEALCREVLSDQTRVLGEEHHDSIITFGLLGRILWHQGRLAESSEVLETNLETRRRLWGDAHPETLSALDDLAMLRKLQGRRGEAEQMYRSILDAEERTLGVDHPSTRSTRLDLGKLLLDLRKLDEAEPVIRGALESYCESHGEEHPTAISARTALAVLLRRRGAYDDAVKQFRKVIELCRSARGPDSAQAAIALNHLGMTLRNMNRAEEAEVAFREAVEIGTRVMGENNLNTLQAMSFLGLALRDQRKFSEGVTWLRKSSVGQRRVLGEAHHDSLDSVNFLGNTLHDMGELEQAEGLFREAMETRIRLIGMENWKTLSAIYILGNILRDQQRTDEAEKMYRKALEASRRHLGEAHIKTLLVLNALALVRRDQGQSAEAEVMFRRVVAGRVEHLGEHHEDVFIARNNLGLAIAGQGRFEEARGHYTELLDQAEQRLPETSWVTNSIRMHLGYSLLELQRFDQAEAHLVAARTSFLSAFGPHHVLSRHALQNLIALYERWGKPDREAAARAQLPAESRDS